MYRLVLADVQCIYAFDKTRECLGFKVNKLHVQSPPVIVSHFLKSIIIGFTKSKI